MKKSILMLSAVCLLIVASCKKDKKTDDQAPDCLLAESTKTWSDNYTEKVVLTYNADGKVSNLKYADGGYTSETIYTYSNSEIKTVYTDSDDNTNTEVYSLDNQGRVISKVDRYTNVISYSYNVDGYLNETNDDGYIVKYSYTNGNLTTVIKGGGNILTYTYGTELSNSNFFMGDFYLSESPLAKYFGKSSKYLPSKCTETHSLDRGVNPSDDEVYTYEKDANGNITKVSVSSTDGDNYVINSKYTCK